MPPKNKPNPFYYFMCERKPQLEKQYGRRLTMKDLPGLCHMEWKSLPNKEKERFNLLCDNAKGSATKYDSRGIPLDEIEAQVKRAAKEKDDMEQYISTLVTSFYKGLASLAFHIVCVEHYVEMDDGNVIPAEIGIILFSFRKGIISEFHRIIEVDCPKGYKHTLMDYSERTHNLYSHRENPIIQNATIRSGRIIIDTLSYLSENSVSSENSDYILYAPEMHFTIAKKVFQAENSPIKVFSLDFLYKTIYNTNNSRGITIPLSIAKDVFRATSFDFNPNCACEFHRNLIMDNINYCALSQAKRCAYTMSDHMDVENRFGIVKIVNKHFPQELISTTSIEGVNPQTFYDPYEQPSLGGASRKGRSHIERVQNYHGEDVSSRMHSLVLDNGEDSDDGDDEFDDSDNDFMVATGGGSRGLAGPKRWNPTAPLTAPNVMSEDAFPKLGKPPSIADKVSMWQPSGMSYSSIGLTGFGRGKVDNKK